MTEANLFPINLSNIPALTKQSSAPIAIVDDDQEQLNIISRYYAKSKRQNELLLFNGAQEVLEYMVEVTEGLKPTPAIILLDINMPGANGFEVLKKLKTYPQFKNVPIVVMFSVSQYQKDIEQAQILGANAYVTKPSRASEYIRLFEML